jgi:hypothetical protein
MKPNAAEKRYFAYVDSLPCCHCKTTVDVTHHHIIVIGMGIMGGKAPHFAIMPACANCHSAIHQSPRDYPQAKWLVETLDQAFKDGVIKYEISSLPSL